MQCANTPRNICVVSFPIMRQEYNIFQMILALWFNRGMGSEMGVAQLLALKVFSSTTLEFRQALKCHLLFGQPPPRT